MGRDVKNKIKKSSVFFFQFGNQIGPSPGLISFAVCENTNLFRPSAREFCWPDLNRFQTKESGRRILKKAGSAGKSYEMISQGQTVPGRKEFSAADAPPTKQPSVKGWGTEPSNGEGVNRIQFDPCRETKWRINLWQNWKLWTNEKDMWICAYIKKP